MSSVGILGLGLHLPPDIRRNDWWPQSTVEQWMADRRTRGAPSVPDGLGPGAHRVLAALKAQAIDPFDGTIERRVLGTDSSVFDMEELAAREALEDAGIEPGAIDLVITSTIVPDVLLSNPACTLHARLGLARSSFTIHTDVATHAFMMQLTLAEAMIRAGRAHRALLVQSCACSRLIDPATPISPHFGDAATAVVVGPVASGHGIVESVQFTDGRYPRTLVAGVPGTTWYAEGRPRLYIDNPAATQRVFLETADRCKESVEAVLAKAEIAPNDVDFVSVHQGAAWLRHVVQDYVGLGSVHTVDLFTKTAYVFASSIPATLAVAKQQGLIENGNRVLLVGGGPGMTSGASLLVWGG